MADGGSNLELLLVPFKRDYDNLLMLRHTLDSVLRLVTNGEPITNKEIQMLSSHTDILTKQLKDDLSNFFSRYEGSNSTDLVAMLLELLPLLQESKNILNVDCTPAADFVSIHLKVAIPYACAADNPL